MLAQFIEFAAWPGWLLTIGIAVGVTLLMFGGQWLTVGAGSLALNLKINPVIVGLTVISVATSMPEMITALVAASKGNAGVAVGNIIGSNICNIGMILAIAALLTPVVIQHRLVRAESPFLVAVTLLFSGFCIGGLARWEGITLLLVAVAYVTVLVVRSQRHPEDVPPDISEELEEPVRSNLKAVLFVLVGGAGLAVGAEILVECSVESALRLGVSEVLIGITVVAVGTSLPELAAAVAAARRRQSDLVAGNIVGSNLFNILLIGGTVSTVYPLPVEPSLFRMEIPAMIFLTVISFFMYYRDRIVSRIEGGLLLGLYVAIIACASFIQITG